MDFFDKGRFCSAFSLAYVQVVVLIIALIIVMLIKTLFPSVYTVLGGYIQDSMNETTTTTLVTDTEKSELENEKISVDISQNSYDDEVGYEDSEDAEYEFDFGAIRKVSASSAAISMSLPIKPRRVSSKFGYRVNPVTGVYGIHGGIDLAADSGTQIKPALSGKVLKAKYSSDYGYFVMLDHGDNLITLYAHCSKLLVKAGDTVDKSDVIALVGSTGRSTGPHLHFEVRINDVRINPEYFLTGLKSA